MPDIIVEGKGLISTGLTRMLDAPYKSCHLMNGIFIAYGPDIAKGRKISGAQIYDIAPTILHMFGLPVPNDMDGKVLNVSKYRKNIKRCKAVADKTDRSKGNIKEEVRRWKSVRKTGDICR